jgi:hypothetical protein
MRYIAYLLALALAGCAGFAQMTENQCRDANWYEVGERDGLLGGPARIDTYAYQCDRHNVQTARDRYLEGWWMGNAEYRHRTAGNESS